MRVRALWMLCLVLVLTGCGDEVPPGVDGVAEVPTAAALARQLEGVSERKRIEAARELTRLGPDARLAIPALARAARDQSEEVRRHVVAALVAVGAGEPDAIRALVALQGDGSPRVAKAARHGLDALNPPRSVARKVVTPATYESVLRRVCVKAEQTKTIEVPAQYATRNGKAVLVKPATTRQEVIPAVYEEVEERVLVSPAEDRWEWTGEGSKKGVDIDWGPKGT